MTGIWDAEFRVIWTLGAAYVVWFTVGSSATREDVDAVRHRKPRIRGGTNLVEADSDSKERDEQALESMAGLSRAASRSIDPSPLLLGACSGSGQTTLDPKPR